MGAAGAITLTFGDLKPEGGDPQDLMGPIFSAEPGDALVAEQDAMLVKLFGLSRKTTQGVSPDQLQAAITKARARAVEILNDTASWKADGRRLRLAVRIPKEASGLRFKTGPVRVVTGFCSVLLTA